MAVMITDLFAGFRKKACKNIHFHLSFFKNVEGCMDVGMAVSKTTELGVWTTVSTYILSLWDIELTFDW